MNDETSESTPWWFNLRTGEVEHGVASPNSERMGPYASEAEARNALARAATRNEQWDRDDE